MLSRVVAAAVCLAAGCTLSEVDLEGKRCPCAPGWRCDEASMTCTLAPATRDAGPGFDAATPDAGAPDAGDAPDGRVVDGGTDRDAGPLEPPFGELYEVMLEGREYRVPEGLVVEVGAPRAETEPLFGPVNAHEIAIAAPPADSAYPRGAYLSFRPIGSALSRVYRVHDGTLSLFASSNGMTGPDGVTRTAIFTPTASAFGDSLFVTGISLDAGDGVFAIGTDGTYDRLTNLNNVYAVAHDCVDLLAVPSLIGVYNTAARIDMFAVDTAGTERTVRSNVLGADRMMELHVACEGHTRGSLLLASVEPATEAPFLRQTSMIDPWAEPSPVIDPTDAVTGIETTVETFGDVLIVSAGTRVTAHFADGESYLVLEGPTTFGQLAYDEVERVLWVVDGHGSLVLRVRRG